MTESNRESGKIFTWLEEREREAWNACLDAAKKVALNTQALHARMFNSEYGKQIANEIEKLRR